MTMAVGVVRQGTQLGRHDSGFASVHLVLTGMDGLCNAKSVNPKRFWGFSSGRKEAVSTGASRKLMANVFESCRKLHVFLLLTSFA